MQIDLRVFRVKVCDTYCRGNQLNRILRRGMEHLQYATAQLCNAFWSLAVNMSNFQRMLWYIPSRTCLSGITTIKNIIPSRTCLSGITSRRGKRGTGRCVPDPLRPWVWDTACSGAATGNIPIMICNMQNIMPHHPMQIHRYVKTRLYDETVASLEPGMP